MSSNRLPRLLGLLFLAGMLSVPLSSCPAQESPSAPKTNRSNAPARIEDDTIASKHPPFVAEYTYPVSGYEGELRWVNASQAVLGLDMVGLTEDCAELDGVIYPNFGEAVKQNKNHYSLLFSLDQADNYAKLSEDRIYAMLEIINHDQPGIYIGGKSRMLEDLLARVNEQPASHARTEAMVYLMAALKLGGRWVGIPSEMAPAVEREVAMFEARPADSKPIGFYSSEKVLQSIFKRDRLLQEPFGSEPQSANDYPARDLAAAVVIASALKSDEALLEAYGKYLRLAEAMTNPASNLSMLDLMPYEQHWDNPEKLRRELEKSPAWQRCVERGNRNKTSLGVAFIPFSTSKENRLFSRIYGDGALPETSTMEDFAGAVRSGDVDLAPEADSGWYDYQLYALEPLLIPERAQEAEKVLLLEKYKKRLFSAFESMATQRRETHVKQVQQVQTFGAATAPGDYKRTLRLMLEPAPTNYLRIARSYAYLQDTLAEVYGAEEYKKLRLDDRFFYYGLEGRPVSERVAETCRIFYGLYLLSCNDLQMAHALEPDDIDAMQFLPLHGSPPVPMDHDVSKYRVLRTGGLERSQQGYVLDAINEAQQVLNRDVNATSAFYDSRVIVPVLSDSQRGKWRYWAVVGVQFKRIKYWYATQPRVMGGYSFDSFAVPDEANEKFAAGEGEPYEYEANEQLVPCYVFTEVTLGGEPPTREEFRAICDEHDTLEEIVAALQREF